MKGILTFLVQETCKYILARLRSRKEKLGLLLRKWGLSGLGSVFIGWAVLSFFGWIAFSVNAAVHEGVASAPTIILATIALGLLVGLPGIALNRVTVRLDSDHWVARMTNAYATTMAQEKHSERESNLSRNRLPHIQFVPRSAHKK